MYSSIIKNPNSSLAIAVEVYFHFLSGVLRGSRPVSSIATRAWNPPRDFPMRGVTTQVYDPKSSTACTMDLKNNPDTRGTDPSLLMMCDILLQTTLSQDKFFTTSGQSLSAADINSTRYLKEVTISRGCP